VEAWRLTRAAVGCVFWGTIYGACLLVVRLSKTPKQDEPRASTR
jgi:hypothetical protein